VPNPIVHFEIPANEPQKLIDFYSKVFDWTIQPAGGPMGYWTVQTTGAGQVGINGGLLKKAGPNQTSLNYVQVDSVDDYTAKIESAGGKVVHARMAVAGMGWFAIATDPEGNAFGIWQNDTEATPTVAR
jgi:predicted enzyme related to lactoylglutathione lyase